MDWRPLASFRDARIPKLDNLRRAARAGFRVPATCWLPARDIDLASPPAWPGDPASGAIILRSASPTEDTHITSHAGQLLSLVVTDPAEYAGALRRVVAALPRDEAGPRGAVFAQPLVRGEEAGVAFFDGFYYERTSAAAYNAELTAGRARGEVKRGQVARGEPWSEWLASVYRVFGGARGDPRLDVEFARDAEGYVLLQVRPALFPVKRNPLLTQANLKETFGEWPSPWTASGVAEAVGDLAFLAGIEPAVRGWGDPLCVELGERPWVNLSVWLRLADHLGVPRAIIFQTIGGVTASAADRRVIWGRLPLALWRVGVGTFRTLATMLAARRGLARLDRRIAEAEGLEGLAGVWAEALRLLTDTALSISGMLALAILARTTLRLPGGARLVTQEMMDDYRLLAALPPERREAGLDGWLARYGHRGPGESDLARPRFAELREVLLADLRAAASSPAPPPRSRGSRLMQIVFRPFWYLDGKREWFRDECMRRWQVLRGRLLDEGRKLATSGHLDAPDDVFWLRREDLGRPEGFREKVALAKARQERARRVALPLTADQDTLTARLEHAEMQEQVEEDTNVFAGIALTPAVFTGSVRKAADLVSLLADSAGLGPGTVLVVPALEPSWAVLFPRVGGVIAEAGGELSHASILLREAGKPAIVNVPGAFARLRDGEWVRLDGRRGRVERVM
jgi:pyruvate,water dikinase